MTFTADAYFNREHAAQPFKISGPADVDDFIDAMLAEPFENSLAVIYLRDRPELATGGPDHEVRVGVNAEDGVGSICLVVDGQVWYADGGKARDDVFYNYLGNEADFPSTSAVPLEMLRAVIKEVLDSGIARTALVNWQSSAAV